jgi:hypothetical protein
MKKYLAIVCTGNKTYHNFSDKDKRNFDVCIIYFNEGKEDFFKSQSEYFFQRKSPKYKLIKEILPLIPWDKYKYIFLPDDDLTISIDNINELFEIADKQKLELCQPSITLPNIDWKVLQDILKLLPDKNLEYSNTPLFEIRKKYSDKQNEINRIIYGCSYPVLLKKYEDSERVIRSVELIEVQCPLLSCKLLHKIYDIIQDPLVVTGFGLDQVWSQRGFVENKYVIDYISAIHMNETHFRQYEEMLKGKREEKDVAEQYQKLSMNPMIEAKQLIEKYNIDNIVLNSEAFEIYIDNDTCNIPQDFGGYESRNSSMQKLIKEAWEKYIKNQIPHKCIKGIVYTGDRYKKDIRYKNCFSMAGQQENYENLIPSFVFESWKEVGINNYEEKINSIIKASKEVKTTDIDERVFWIGNCNSNHERWKYIDYSKTHSKTTLFLPLKWLRDGKEDLSKTTPSFISLEDHSKYRVLLDGIPNGYSGRIPFILATGRPIIIHERPFEQWFFYDGTFKPWVHYIPLKDISELDKIIKWTIDNKDECVKIGKMGQEYVLKFMTIEKILERTANVLLSKIQKKHKLDSVYCQIKMDSSAFKYTHNTQKLLDIAMASTYKLDQFILKIEIKNNKIKVLHNIKQYGRRGEGLIKVVEMALKYGKIRDGILYLHVADEYVYQFPNLPIFIIAKPKDKNGILMVDNTFVDVEPETKTAETKSIMIDWEENGKMVNEKCNDNKLKDKMNKVFFIGQNISLKKTNFNMRKWLNDEMSKIKTMPLEVLLTDKSGYVPTSDFCKYKYLLNLPGMSPWSFRFKFLFLMKSLIINVALYRQYGNAYDEKWINIFDSIFIPNKDYIELSYNYNENENQNDNLKKLITDIDEIYKIMEKDTEFYNRITNSGYKKGKIINNKNISKIAYKVLNEYTSRIANIISNDFKYKNFDFEKLVKGQLSGLFSKFIGKGIQGIIYSIRDSKANFNFVIKITDMHFGVFDSFREVFFSDILNESKQQCFLKYYDTQIIYNKTYMAMQQATGDLIKWSLESHTYDEWKNMMFQIVLGIIYLQKMKIVHNDLQPKNILFDKRNTIINYKIKEEKYNIKSNYQFYISDFGISAHPDLNINLLSSEQMSIPNYDLKKFSRTPEKLKAINVKNKYSYEQLIEICKKEKINFQDKLKKLQNKVKDWKIDNKYKQEYIHLHLAYYYVKKGLFKDDYTNNSPKIIPDKVEVLFNELRECKTDLNDWLKKYL